MKTAAANQGFTITDKYVDGVALNRKGDKGRDVWILWPSGVVDGPYLSVDCAAAHHYQRRVDQGRIIEVSAVEADRHGFYGVGPVRVTVFFFDPLDWVRGFRNVLPR
jgi:NAD(P)-dependent dehydrogenase (short-subunit alcohol dehydrogenase family)